jgi:hypothetical protein
MRRGPPAPGAPMAGSFGLFLLPRGRPRCFFPVAVDLAAAEEEEGSMALGSSLSLSLFFDGGVVLEASGVQRRSRGCNLKRAGRRQNVMSQCGTQSDEAVPLQ